MLSKDVLKTLSIAWPLLAGIAFIMVGNGLQGTLLSLRAHAEGFPVFATGLVMSAYYLGFLIGCILVPKLIASVGHIRVFAGFASLASSTVLFHGIFVDPYTWGIVRIISGFSFVGLFVVSESWLNSIAPNKLRGQIFSAYLFVVHGGLFAGQFFINLVPVEQIELFIVVSVVISISIIPITLANRPTPGFEEPEHMPFKNLFSQSPLPLLGVFTSGLAGATILTMGPIYAQKSGMENSQIALFMGAYIMGATLLPLLIGWLSDRVDRRLAILAVASTSCLIVALIIGLPFSYLIGLIFVLGGMVTSLYSVSIAFMNDRIKASQMTSVSASLILLNGIGCCIGPLSAGLLIDHFDKDAMFAMLFLTFFMTAVFGVYRAFTGRPVNIEKQGDFVFVPARSSQMVIQINDSE